MMPTEDQAAFAELKELVASKSRAELIDYLQEQDGGTQHVLDQIFVGMPAAFRPEKATDQEADFQYFIDTPEGIREYFVRVHDGACEAGRGTIDDPRLTMKVGLADFLRLVTGKLNGTQAFLTGKVRLTGDMYFATKFENWFERA